MIPACEDCGCCSAAVPGVPLCWECDAGEPCKKGITVPPPSRTPSAIDTVSANHRVLVPKAKRIPAPVEIYDEKPKRGRGRVPWCNVSTALQEKILDASPQESTCGLARRLDVSRKSVQRIRKRGYVIPFGR